jgi:hypothetical protein
MLESLFAPLFFVLIVAVLIGVAFYRRQRGRTGTDVRRAPGEVTREEWEARRRKTG